MSKNDSTGSEETKPNKPTAVITMAVPSKEDNSESITPLPTGEGLLAQSTNTADTTTTGTPDTHNITSPTPSTTSPRPNLPSYPTTFTNPWTFDPRPPPRKIKTPPRVRDPLPTSNASPTATSPNPTPLPVVFPFMGSEDDEEDTLLAPIPPHVAARLMTVDPQNEWIVQERKHRRRLKQGGMLDARSKWQDLRRSAHKRGLGMEEWEGGWIVAEEEEEERKKNEEEEEGKPVEQNPRIKFVGEDAQGNTRPVKKLRSESEQEVFVGNWQKAKEQNGVARWDRLSAEDKALMARVMQASMGAETEPVPGPEEGEGDADQEESWVQQTF